MWASLDQKTFSQECSRVLSTCISPFKNPTEGGCHEVHFEKCFQSQGDSRLERPQKEPKLGWSFVGNGWVSQHQVNIRDFESTTIFLKNEKCCI